MTLQGSSPPGNDSESRLFAFWHMATAEEEYLEMAHWLLNSLDWK